MIVLTLLMITIGGIAAIPHGNTLGNDLLNVNRTKRDSGYGYAYVGSTLRGEPVSVEFKDENNGWRFLHPVLGDRADNIYRRIIFNITRDLGYTSWDIFRSNYRYAKFNKELHIEFSRTDGEGKKFDVRLTPEQFKLTDIKMTYENPEQYYNDDNTFYFMNGKQSSVKVVARSEIDSAIAWYHRRLFSEAIWVGAARLKSSVDLALEGYKIGDHLMFQMIYRVKFSSIACTAGINFKMSGENEINFI